MQVVLFCGGFGMRLRGFAPGVPKPLVKIGDEPILGHLMRWYAHHGHRDFVLCLGHDGDAIVRHFLESPDRVGAAPRPGHACRLHLRTRDLGDWVVTLVPTGDSASVGERLRAVQGTLEGTIFLANYADGLSDLDLPEFFARFAASGALAGLVTVKPPSSLHAVSVGGEGLVDDVRPLAESGFRVNGGFFAFRQEVFARLAPGEDLVPGLLSKLAVERQLFGYPHDGFWACMDTAKDWQRLEEMERRGVTPWKVWRLTAGRPSSRSAEAPIR
jgi:glucose-1-phosphate cytidylyltransferase